jgi:hypothetical protein
MTQIVKIDDSCPFCGKFALVLAPSGANLICKDCNKISVQRPHYDADERRKYGNKPGRPRTVAQ